MNSSEAVLAVRNFLALAVLGSFSLLATPIATENFESYPTGELNGQNGGTGWGGAWTAVTGATEVVAPGLQGNRALQVTGNSSNVAHRQLSAAVSDTEVFLGFLFRADAGSIDNNDFLAFWFDNNAVMDHTSVPNTGLKGNQGNGSGPGDLFGRVSLGTGESYAAAINVGETHLVVARLYKDGSATYNRIQVWVDPLNQGSPSVTASGPGAIGSFNRIGLRSANLDASDSLLVDDVRLATTFGEAVSFTIIPEPSTLVLLGSALLGIGLIHSRRAKKA